MLLELESHDMEKQRRTDSDSRTSGRRAGLQPTEPGTIDFTIENLLPIPQIALKIIRMVGDDNISFSKIAHEVIQDQVLSARPHKTV